MHEQTGSRTALAPAVAPVLASDPHGFAGLYIRHRSSFTSHARRYLRDPRDADEVVQEAFLRLFLAMPELETELQALAYCRRTITNLCIDRYRADARRPRLVALEGTPAEDLAEDDSGDPVVRAEDAALVREALSQLPTLHRDALVKREIEEKPLPVIADELDVAEDSVKHLLFRARRNLRKLLAGTSVAPGVDAELTHGLRPVARGASGGVAGLLLLALLGLGSGPDLRSVPVVGVDLPDVLGVTAVADAVGGAVRDVVDAIVPGERAEASAAARSDADPDRAGRPGSRSEALAQGIAPAGAAAGSTAGASGPAAGPLVPARRGAPAGTGSGPTTTVVNVVDGVPVVSVVPSTVDLLPSVGAPVTAPGTSTGRAPLPYLPVPAAPRGPAGRDVAPGFPGAAAPVGPSLPITPGRDDSGTRGAQDAADRADDAAAKADRAADRTADKAADAAERAQEKVAKAAEQSPAKAVTAAEQAADKAQKAAEKAQDKVDKAADKAAAEKSAKAAADRAAEKAAAQRAAAERAAAERAAAAAAAAERAAAERAAAAAAAAAAAERAAAAAAAAAAQVPAPLAVVTGAVVPAPAP